MTVKNSLTERYEKILRATIKHYIATAEPVGSKTLIQEYDFMVSSATIRNAMGKLEKAGLLYQPYTSAGRIPSDSGYRIYVDRLISPDEKIKTNITKLLTKKINYQSWSYEALLQQTTEILARLSGCIALITIPQTENNILHHLQLVRLATGQIMLIMVIDSYQTESILLANDDLLIGDNDTSEDLIDSELQILSNFLNSKLKGRSLSELYSLDWTELDQEFKNYTKFINFLLQQINSRYQLSSSTPIMIKGISEVVRQPEFSQVEQVHSLLHLLEQQQEQLLPLIFDVSSLNQSFSEVKVKVSIGSENPLESMQSCSLISAVYRQGNNGIGSVGIIGPTRISYENAIALVESTADYLSSL